MKKINRRFATVTFFFLTTVYISPNVCVTVGKQKNVESLNMKLMKMLDLPNGII